MDTVQELEARRDAILEQMRSIRSMRRGTINEQHFKVRLKGTRGVALQGPYYVLSRREGKKITSKRLRAGPEVEQAQRDVAEYKRFVALCHEFERLTARLGERERGEQDVRREKKRSRSPLSRTER